MDFTNVKVRGIHVSRYLASWFNAVRWTEFNHGDSTGKYFHDWLSQLKIDGEYLTEEEIDQIYNWCTCGKMELEHDALEFIEEN